MKVLKKILRQNLKWVILAFFFAIVHNCIGIIHTHFIGNLVNRIVARSAISTPLILLFLFFVLANTLSSYGNHMIGQYAAERAAHSLRMGFARFLLRGGFKEDPKNRGPISEAQAMSIVQGELTRASDYLSNSFFNNVGMLITSILVLIFLLF